MIVYTTQFHIKEFRRADTMPFSEAVGLSPDFHQSQADILEQIARQIRKGHITPPKSIVFEVGKVDLANATMAVWIDSEIVCEAIA